MLAFRSFPLILVVGALSALLYHWRVLPLMVRVFAWLLAKTMRIGGAASFATAANIFVGMVESPLIVKPYLDRMSRADLFVVMTAGLASIAGTVYALYSILLQDLLPNAAGHLLTASVLSAPAAVVVARLMIPTGSGGAGERIEFKRLYDGTMDAITAGTIDGLKLAGIRHRLRAGAGGAGGTGQHRPRRAAGCPGRAPHDAAHPRLGAGPGRLAHRRALGPRRPAAGQLLGSKIVLTEFVAYLEMSQLGPGELGERSRLILAYAMCGFANFGGLGIMLGGLGALVPSRRKDVLELGMKSLIAGNIRHAHDRRRRGAGGLADRGKGTIRVHDHTCVS